MVLLLLLFVLVGFFGVFGAAQFAFWATEVDKFFNLKSDARRTRVSLEAHNEGGASKGLGEWQLERELKRELALRSRCTN